MFCKEQRHGGERGQVGGGKSGKHDYSGSGKMAAGVRVGVEGEASGLTWDLGVLQRMWWENSRAGGHKEVSRDCALLFLFHLPALVPGQVSKSGVFYFF